MREPVRLVAALTPFNHPLNQVAHKVAPAIAAGAPVVVKPSERTPLAGLWLGLALRDAGLPPEALSVVTGCPEVILDAMLADPGVEVVSFTGSVPVGRMIAARLGYRRAVLERSGTRPAADQVREFLGRRFNSEAYEKWLSGAARERTSAEGG